MFFSRCKENARAWKARAQELESRIGGLEAEVEQERRGRLAAEAQAAESQGEIDKCQRIYQTMGKFATSFLELQRSQLAIANTMKTEKQ
ncbi:MAG: hypothetical protein K8F27_15905, partial [Sulfuricellaceae bacterium]|nr:hypothetical protein [Sulfuricellaceae bacterium]